MVKARKIRVGDFVTHAHKEYVVVKKDKVNYRLVPRYVRTAQPITVPKKRVKLADQLWRTQLQRGDEVTIFLGGEWINGLVYAREGKTLEVQPLMNNFTMQMHQDAGTIAKARTVGSQPRGTHHGYPPAGTHAPWVKDKITPVVIDGACHIERGEGLLFPWTYTSPTATRVEVSGPIKTPLTTLKFPKYETTGFPLKMYKNLSTAEIMHDICTKKSSHPDILVEIAKQWCNRRLAIYPCDAYRGLRFYISQALAYEDDRRVQELLSVGAYDCCFHRSEWRVRNHLSHPYIEVDVALKGNALHVSLYHSGIQIDKTCDSVRKILQHISSPMIYAPPKLAVDAAPEMQYVLSRMLGMEQTPVELLSTRKINGSKIRFNVTHGFCNPEMRTCGGQLNMPFIEMPKLIKELMKRSPMRTLIVVETSALPMWKDFNIYYGRHRSFEPVTVTTKTMFARISRNQRVFDSAERLIMVSSTYWCHAAACAARRFRCKAKWAVGCGTTPRNTAIFDSRDCNNDLCINLSKSTMQQMGVQFPQFIKQEVIFNVKPDRYKFFMDKYKNSTEWYLNNLPVGAIIDNVRLHRRARGTRMLELYLEHPQFVPIEHRGEKLDAVEATLSNISDKFGVSEKLLQSRAKETCSVCLETITDAAVTPCGHIFCSTCMKELHKRRINCPMCRSKIPSFLKLSDRDTMGTIEMHLGTPYRLPHGEDWGKKIQFLKQHKDATIIVNEKDLQRKLKKVLKKTQILTTEEIANGAKPINSTLVSLKPISTDFLEAFVGAPWGKDITLFALKYRLPEKPFGQEFY